MPKTAVLATGEYKAWFDGLSRDEQGAVIHVLEKLMVMGIVLGAPHSLALEGTDLGRIRRDHVGP